MNQAAALIALLAVAWPTAASTVEDPAVQQLAAVSIFLATHQEADGRWDDRGEAAQPEAGVAPAAAVLTTGLAIQVQLHSGQRDSAQRGLAWLQRQQGADGGVGATNTEQAIATRAFLEGWFAGDETCEAPARRSLEQLAQRRIRPYCWPEKPGEAEVIDVETSFWCQQAARAVADRREAGAASMLIAAAWRERNSGPIATPQTNGGRILHPTTFPARFVSGPQGGLAIDYTAGEAPAAGLFLLGQSGDWDTDDAPFSLANRVASDLAVQEGVAPNWRQRCIARTALGSFRYPPLPQPDRTQWERLLAQGFRAAGPHAGSWDPHADRPADGGRITTTCFAALTAWRSVTPPAPTSRIDGALSFLKRAQESDGRWSANAWTLRCPGGTEPLASGAAPSDLELTALATACFQGDGYDHKTPNKYRKVVDDALAWLVSHQGDDGGWHGSCLEHALAAHAVSEAYAMTNDPDLKRPAQHGINALLLRRHALGQQGPAAWPSAADDTGFDTTTTLFCLMALDSARAGGLNVGDGFAGIKRWWQAALRAGADADTQGFPTRLTFDGSLPAGTSRDAWCSGVLAGFLLEPPADPSVLAQLAKAGFTHELAALVGQRSTPRERWLTSLALFRGDALVWRRWAVAIQGTYPSAPQAGCTEGSLLASAQVVPHPDPLSASVYGLLAVEVLYRFAYLNLGER